MMRSRLAAAAVLSLSLLAPVAVASTAAAAPKTCSESVLVKDHKVNKAQAKAKNAKAKAKAKGKGQGKAKKHGHAKPSFVHAGKVNAVDATAGTVTFVVRGGQNKALRGCLLTVVVTATTKIQRDDVAATLADVVAGDHVNVKGGTTRDAVTGDVTYTATRVSASAPEAETTS